MEWLKFLAAPAALVFLAAIFKDALATALGYKKARMEEEKTAAQVGAEIRAELRDDIKGLRERVTELEAKVKDLSCENKRLRDRLASEGIDTQMINMEATE